MTLSERSIEVKYHSQEIITVPQDDGLKKPLLNW